MMGIGMGWGVITMTLLGVLLVGLLVAATVVLTRYAGRGLSGGPGGPEQVLAARFARGEIDEQEYRARLAALRESDRATW